MNSQQYNRANKRVFLAVIIVFAYIAFTLFAAVGTKDADITRISIQLVVKSKFVCKFIFQLCGFTYATFIFKRFD